MGVLGYNARGLQYGMMGWSNDKLPGGTRRFPADQHDLPFVDLAAQ